MAQSQAEIQVILSQTRGAGSTTIVRGLGIDHARANKRTLMVDLDLWTVELSASYHQSHANKLVQLAEQYWHDGTLTSNALESATVPCEENLWLLPNSLSWLASSYLGGEIGYDFIRILLESLRLSFASIFVDLGTSNPDANTKSAPFLLGCAAHLAATESASRIFYVFSSPLEYEKWRVGSPRLENPDKVFLLVNRAKKQKRETLMVGSYPIPLAFIEYSKELYIEDIILPVHS